MRRSTVGIFMGLAVAASSTARLEAAATVPQAINLIGTYLANNQDLSGSWTDTLPLAYGGGSTTAYTGVIDAGEASAYLKTGTAAFKTSSDRAGNFIVTVETPFGYYGDEGFGLVENSQASATPAANPYRAADTTFYNVSVPASSGGTAGYINNIVSHYSAGADQSQAVYYLAYHTMAAYYVNATDENIWRTALRQTLAQVDNADQLPVLALGVATWALAQTGPLDSTLVTAGASSPSPFWAGQTLANLPADLAALEETTGGHAGSFYAEFGSMPGLAPAPGSIDGNTQDTAYGVLGLSGANVLAQSGALANGVTLGQQVLAANVDANGQIADNFYSPAFDLKEFQGDTLLALTAAAPEPASLSLLAVGTLMMSVRRRRSRSGM